MSWGALEEAAPEIARLGKERFETAGVALLGTLRADGSPRISPVEPFLTPGELLFGVMPWSGKARDLERDPRCVLHSAVTGSDAGEGELKLYGRAVEVEDEELRGVVPDAWWVSRPREDARVLSLAIEQAAFLSWDAANAEMTAREWSPARGFCERRRGYP
jgi:hypothetical protein